MLCSGIMWLHAEVWPSHQPGPTMPFAQAPGAPCLPLVILLGPTFQNKKKSEASGRGI